MERTTEESGQVAVDLPGWEWMAGMCDTTGARVVSAHYGSDGWSLDIAGYWAGDDDTYPDPDDSATAGCLLALLGEYAWMVSPAPDDSGRWFATTATERHHAGIYGAYKTFGRACIAAAEALGRWPGGATK